MAFCLDTEVSMASAAVPLPSYSRQPEVRAGESLNGLCGRAAAEPHRDQEGRTLEGLNGLCGRAAAEDAYASNVGAEMSQWPLRPCRCRACCTQVASPNTKSQWPLRPCRCRDEGVDVDPRLLVSMASAAVPLPRLSISVFISKDSGLNGLCGRAAAALRDVRATRSEWVSMASAAVPLPSRVPQTDRVVSLSQWPLRPCRCRGCHQTACGQ